VLAGYTIGVFRRARGCSRLVPVKQTYVYTTFYVPDDPESFAKELNERGEQGYHVVFISVTPSGGYNVVMEQPREP